MSTLKIPIKYIFVLAMLFAFTGICSGATTTWKGTTSSDWNTASNWSNGVPTSSLAVTIGGGTYQPTLSVTAPAGIYQCASLTVSGTATLQINSGYTLSVAGDLTIGTSASLTVAGSGTLSVGGNYNNYGTSVFGSSGPGSVTFSGNYTDYNYPTTFGTESVTFSTTSKTNTIQIVPSDVLTFTYLTFTGGTFQLATGTHNTGSFALTSTGVLSFTHGAQLQVTNAYGFTFYSDANGSATLAAIPSGCGFKGSPKYYVQRFIKGSSDLSKRGYRLMSSSVYTGTDVNSSNVYDLQYLLSSIYVSGPGNATNGFNVPTTTNPSLYLFREDDPPPPTNSTIFTTAYNWKGVAQLGNNPSYLIGTQTRNNHANTNDTLTSIPVGNGFLMLFRGDKSTTKNYTFPYNGYVQDVTLTESGTINTGTINVRLWFSVSGLQGNNLGNYLSYTSSTTAAATGSKSALTGGFALVGNPYPSTINWEKFNANSTIANSSIYGGGGLTGTIYTFDVLTKQYDSYIPAGADTVNERPTATNSVTGKSSSWTGSATNLIASGQGFFVQANTTGQSLSFRETAKSNTQPTATLLQPFMGKPVATSTGPNPLLRLRLVKDSINHDEIVIRLSRNSDPKYKQGEDALDLGGNGALESLSAISSDSVKLAINSIPFPGKEQEVIRLLADATGSGVYQLNRIQLDYLPQLYTAWLKDAFTGDSVNLRTTNTYSFQIDKNNPATFGANRFTVVISQDPAYAYRLLSFTAARVGNSSNVETHWQTANEENYTNFTIERSNDGGKTFTVVGGMWGTGASDYALMDKNVPIGTNLYRLKSEDINNTITYSNIATVVITDKGNGNEKLNVYPNPATSVVNLDLLDKTKANTSYNIIVSNSTGFIVKQAISIQPNWQANISDLMPGTYLVRVTNNKTNDFIGESKFVKL